MYRVIPVKLQKIYIAVAMCTLSAAAVATPPYTSSSYKLISEVMATSTAASADGRSANYRLESLAGEAIASKPVIASSNYKVRPGYLLGTNTNTPSPTGIGAVTYPSDSGITWQRKTTQTITWANFTGSKVNIYLYKNKKLNKTIVKATNNDGSFDWSIPANQGIAGNYIIRIVSTTTAISKFDDSDNFFAISK